MNRLSEWELKLELLVLGVRGNLKPLRIGGGGPTGGVGFKLNECIISAPFKQFYVKKSPYEIINQNEKNILIKNGIKIGEVLLPKAEYYNYKLKSGVRARRVVALDGVDALVTAISRKCIFWDQGKKCSFCGLEYGIENAIVEKTPDMIAEAVKVAYEEDKNRHLTITSGLSKEKDFGALKIAEVVRVVKKEVDIPIYVQIPPISKETIERLYEVGTDNIGINVETFDSSIREKVVPAKFRVDDYFKVWKIAVDVFGEWNVSTWIILGLGERPISVIKGVEKTAQLGVVPYISPYRPHYLEKNNCPDMRYLRDIHSHLRDVLVNFDVDLNKHNAGCVRCGGCSVLKELIC